MSHLHWLQARMVNAIPAGVTPYRGADGQPPLRAVAPSELAQHASRASLWLCVHSRVYDCTAYATRHPGGIKELLKGTGKDCTALFTAAHPWVNLDLLLGAAFLVGELGPEEGSDEPAATAAAAADGAQAAQGEAPWVHLACVRPLGAAAPAAPPQSKPPPPPSLPCAACRDALAGGSLVLWRQLRQGQQAGVCGAWPWGTSAEAQGSSGGQQALCVVARGRAAQSLPALLARLGHQGVRVVWDMRGQEAQPWARRAALALQPHAAAVSVLQEEAAEGHGAAAAAAAAAAAGATGLELAGSPGGAAQAAAPWHGSLPLHQVRTGKDPLLHPRLGLPAPHAGLLVVALSHEPSGEWELEWDEELRAGYYAADLLLAATLPA